MILYKSFKVWGMVKRSWVRNIIYVMVVASLPFAVYSAEIIYDSPEDLRATDPSNVQIQLPLPANEPAPVTQEGGDAAPSGQTAPTEEQARQRFAALKKEIDEGTQNLDKYFEYAQMATAFGEHNEAVNAYSYMLAKDSSLDRVRLELGLVYVRMGKLKESKQLFEEVLAKNPPDEVKANIGKVMEIVDKGLRPDVFSGSVSTGYNIDTNANSAASSGQTTFVDTSIPLSAGSTASRDGHFYASASLTHLHKFDIDNDFYKLNYETTGTVYRTHQDTETSLDIGLLSLKTGPAMEFPDLKTKVGVNATGSMIELDGNRYMKTRSWGSDVTYALMDNLLLNGAYSYEYRKFINTLVATTYTDRSGNANQQVLGITYALTPIDIFNTSVTWRYENAENDIYGTTQASITGSYTRVLPWDLTLNTLAGYKKTNYHQPDPLVSATTLRHDRERNMTLTLAKKLPHNMSATTSYQYKNAESNIQNYKYNNNRYSLGLSWAF